MKKLLFSFAAMLLSMLTAVADPITLSGVKSVDSFSPQSMKLTTDGGKVNILGENLKVLSFSKQSGAFSAEGRVDGLRFSGAKTGLMKKVFR